MLHRAWVHRSLLRRGVHQNGKLQNFWNKYGRLTFEPIYRCAASDLQEWEQIFIDTLKPTFNILKVAYSSQGYKHGSDALAKIKKHSKERGADQLKPFQFKKGKENFMKKGKFAACHKATSKPIKATKAGCQTRVFKSVGSAARMFGVDSNTVAYRAKGRIASDFKGWAFSYA